MSADLLQLKSDLSKLQVVLGQLTSSQAQSVVSGGIASLQKDIASLEDQVKVPQDAASSSRRYEVKLTNYTWGQDDDAVQVYVALPEANKAEKVFCTFSKKGLELHVQNLQDKDYVFKLGSLSEEIVPETSSWKVKTSKVILNGVKKDKKNWSSLNSSKKAIVPPPAMDESADPSESLMSLMKNMYEQGDDQMKQTITKAMMESQMKKGQL